MSITKDIEFHTGETWQIVFTAHNADGSVLVLDGTVSVRFRINDKNTVILTKSIGDGIVVVDANAGKALITVTPTEQAAAAIVRGKTYQYEVSLTTSSFVSVQSEGAFHVLPSLFG